ncbi:nitrate- and nitrite sensing domain-containing protein [Micromonospora sp. KC721]|uniref:sensor histidine kinase n=1 Tax=Micromonospora sp. KC721 TaxID=2530380 RepID=UPI00104428E7|nr:nitrate- and nitrite sensing domain-containing protein [Micromonospora sp. KC721]TDB74309.1 sensor histidine kinase [Micromonospora sp. KC721]
MGSRSAGVRTRVVAVLVALAALWAFAAWVTLRDAHTVLSVQTLEARVAEPGEALRTELQRERRLSLVYLGRPSQAQAQALGAQRRSSEESAAVFAESARSWRVRLASSAELTRRIDEATTRLDSLAPIRDAVADRAVDRAGAAEAFTAVVDSLFRVYAGFDRLDDARIAEDTATLIHLVRVRELMSQQDALLAGAAATGRVNDREYAQFAHLVGAQRFLAAEALAELPAADRDRYLTMLRGESFTRLRTLEDRLIRDGRPNGPLPVDAVDWQAAVDAALGEQEVVVLASARALVDRATPVAIWVIVRTVLVAGLGLIVVIASMAVSVSTARTLGRRLAALQAGALRLATERLPGLVDRLDHGEQVDLAPPSAPLDTGDDAIGQVGRAFDVAQEAAVRTAVEQVELRRAARAVFLSLARRTQALVRHQLALLDAMERRVHDAEELEDLFRVDHLATRMRRNAENLIVLAGSTPGRAWRRHVPVVDVIRGAVAEVEDYTRVDVAPLGPVSLAGRAVGDVIHLLAELIENALTFSPPHTPVEVRGQQVANGFAVEIEDRGRGMSTAELTEANQRLVDRAELNLVNTSRLGLYVVSRLTERHGVRVRLTESPYGGVTAVVFIPGALVEVGEDAPGGAAPGRTGGQTSVRGDDGDPVGELELPVRARRASTSERPADEPELPNRTKAGSARAALHGPTVPTALSTVRPAPALAGADAAVGGSGQQAGVVGTEPGRVRSDWPVTDLGLPMRIRQASIVPELRGGPPGEAPERGTGELPPRPPEQVRQMMSSYQTGTRRGRTEAARLLGGSASAGARTGGGPGPGNGSET